MNGVIYCRVSDPGQIEGTSLESQQLACEEYARQHKISISRTFIEEGESAKFADRTQLLELIDFCQKKKNQVQALLVWKVDRFARNATDHFGIKAMLHKAGVRIYSVTEPINPDPEGQLMEGVLAVIAQYDNDIRARRTVQGMATKLRHGIFPWRPPLGYRTPTLKGDKKLNPDEPDQPLFGILQKAWKEFAAGAYTKADIRRLMISWGVQSYLKHPLRPQNIDYLFRNRYYAGILTDPWTGEEFEGRHVPMVSKEDFAKVQVIISKRSRSIPHQKCRDEFPLRGLLRCPNCQRLLTASFSRGRGGRYPYYHCQNRECADRNRSLAAGTIHEEFEHLLSGLSRHADSFTRLEFFLNQSAKDRQNLDRVRQDKITMKLEQLNRQNQELIRIKTQGLITDEEFLAQKRDLQDRRAALEASAETSHFRPDEIQKRFSEIVKPLSAPLETWRGLPCHLRERFHRWLLPGGFVAGDVGTAEKAHVYSLNDIFPQGNTSLVPQTGKSWNRICEEITEFADLYRSYLDHKERSTEGV